MRDLPTLSALKFLNKLRRPGRMRGTLKTPPLPKQPEGINQQFDQVEDKVQAAALAIGGDYKLAKKLMRMLEENPGGTLPEMLVLEWLIRQQIRYVYQAALYGGNVAGGTIPDFAVYDRTGKVSAWNVQGNYWHNRPGKAAKDARDKVRMLGTSIGGEKIQRVVYLWESRIMKRDRSTLFAAAMSGLELGP